MLVLSRKDGQSVHIGTDVTITVKRSGNGVKLCIDAPNHVRIVRAELPPLEAGPANHGETQSPGDSGSDVSNRPVQRLSTEDAESSDEPDSRAKAA